MSNVNFSELIGKTLDNVEGLESGGESVRFFCSDGSQYTMFHPQDCCELVSIEEVFGDVDWLIGSPIVDARKETSNENPSDAKPDTTKYQDSFTWTFYIIATNKGSVTIRWYGESNGYYGEGVDFVKEGV